MSIKSIIKRLLPEVINYQPPHEKSSGRVVSIHSWHFKECTEEWKAIIQKKVDDVTTDSIQNVWNAVIECLVLPAIPCARHNLNLTAQDGLGFQEVQTALAQVKKIVTSFLKSRQDSETVKDKQKQIGLPQHELTNTG